MNKFSCYVENIYCKVLILLVSDYSMDESDEDVDPLVGPVADLMAEHNLSSTASDTQKPLESIGVLEKKRNIFDYLSLLNIRTLFKDIFHYILDLQWYYYLTPKIEQEYQSSMISSLKKLALLSILYAILTLPFPWAIHLLPIFYIFYLLITDFLVPFSIYYNWFQCLHALRRFITTIQTHQQWLIKIHGFQLIRPTSSLFESQLYQLRRTIFEELKKHFLFTRQIARQYSPQNDQLICYIDLHEFGPLIQNQDSSLEEITNQFDQISINSMFKLCHLQINECIQLIHLHRPKSYWIFQNYQTILGQSIENLNQIKQNCSIMIDYIDSEKPSAKKLISAYFLLRSNCEQLFDMNEKDCTNPEQLKRIIQDLKTVLCSLEAIQSKPMAIINQTTTEQILSNEHSLSNISSYHRFDDQLAESMDEILICHTGQSTDEMTDDILDLTDYDQRLLREQTNCLMQELQTAIQGKKQEWNEREQRLLGNVENQEEIPIENKPIIDEQPCERVSPIQNPISMLDELRHSFVVNRKKLHLDEDIFGEEEIESSDDDQSR